MSEPTGGKISICTEKAMCKEYLEEWRWKMVR